MNIYIGEIIMSKYYDGWDEQNKERQAELDRIEEVRNICKKKKKQKELNLLQKEWDRILKEYGL